MNLSIRKAVAIGAALLITGVCLTACTSGHASPSTDAQHVGQKTTQQLFNKENAAQPVPVNSVNDSDERKNLIEKLLRYNDPNKISYIYLIAFGQIEAYYTIKGKVTANSSQLTNTQTIETNCHSSGSTYACNDVPVDAPQDDGSYGGAEPGIFFFTTDNVMVTWSGDYLLTDAPMKLDPAKVALNYVSGSKPSSTGKK